MPRSPVEWLRGRDGSSAVEFALLIPLAVLLVFAIFHLCFLVYAQNSLNWAVEQSARCAAISQRNTSLSCTTRTATKSYAVSAYKGPGIGITTASFTPTNDTTNKCRRVSGSGTYHVQTGLFHLNATVSAQACFPADTSVSWPA